MFNKIGTEKAQSDIDKVNRACLNVLDGGQSISPIDEFLNLHHASSEIIFLFTGLFKYLYEQEIEGVTLDYNKYEKELQKKLDVLKNNLVSRKMILD
ncbi:hypothetical protein MKZ08_06700 [Viridibacillus sp. FSL R5-0477]|uniref:Uncharacterized protein n=1 Tax=Viridibacillus arenosi FSL R5-213 TaxID=1227360 RepID=W4EQZ8_9BACL|nr:hypothetical protein [Viridibacillus arenosi]ETT82251.1 hypothetical protein C176_14712 [Viridibacillus arenosi FSL R5-213]OMC92644.1 hypothetical protein BK137_06285 [Viridibacillus arenosi]